MGILRLTLLLFQATLTSALEWTSTDRLPNGTVIPACPEQDVMLAWSYTAAADEHLVNVEWHYTSAGGDVVLLATQVMGSFFAAPSLSQHLKYLPNAGIRLQNVALADAGAYSVHVNMDVHGTTLKAVQTADVQVTEQGLTTDGQLHVEMLEDAVYDSSTLQYHVQLACGQFLPVWRSRVAVVWKTPSGQTLPSTSYDNGIFLLSVPNPVISGDYSCAVDSTSPASLCAQNGSPLQRGVAATLDGVQSLLLVMETRMKIMQQKDQEMATELHNTQQKNADLQTQLHNYQQNITNVETAMGGYQTQLTAAQQKIAALETEMSSLQTQLHSSQQKIASLESQMSSYKSELSSVRQNNTALVSQMKSFQQEITALTQRLQNVPHNVSLADTTRKHVLFHAQMTMNVHALTGDHVRPNNVLINVGDGYDPHTGEFVAPYDGSYFFTATAEAYLYSKSSGTPYDSSLALMVDSTWFSYIYTRSVSYYEQGTCSYATHLTRGQRVWLQSSGDCFFGVHVTTFTGMLVSAD